MNMSGWNRHKKNSWYYPDLESARRPVPHCEEVPIPVFSSLPKLVSNDDLFAETEEVNSDDSNYSDSISDTTAEWQSKVKPFSQSQLNDLVKDLALSKEASEVLASRFCEHDILDFKTKITFCRHRDEALSDYFTKENNFVFCKNVKGLLTAMGGPQYKPGEWRLYIDSSKQSFKCVLLHSASSHAGVVIGHLVTLKESYSTVQMVLQKLCYRA